MKPPVFIWVCMACGNWAYEREQLEGISCDLNAEMFEKDACEFDEAGDKVIGIRGGKYKQFKGGKK